jgi:hypothetical protein
MQSQMLREELSGYDITTSETAFGFKIYSETVEKVQFWHFHKFRM